MGDRVSIAFRNHPEGEDSVVLFNHWGGTEFPDVALDYARQLKVVVSNRQSNYSTPLSRLEPNVVMVDFIRFLSENKNYHDITFPNNMTGSLYFGATELDGDNSDNGHYVIDLESLMFAKTGRH